MLRVNCFGFAVKTLHWKSRPHVAAGHESAHRARPSACGRITAMTMAARGITRGANESGGQLARRNRCDRGYQAVVTA